MSENKEIKLNQEAFNTTMSELTEYNNTLVQAKDSIIAVYNNMEKEWVGDGGTAFTLSANVIESKFLERINDLQEEVNDLKSAAFSMFELEGFIAKFIAGAIFGPGAAIGIDAANSIDDIKKAGTVVNDLINNGSNK